MRASSFCSASGVCSISSRSCSICERANSRALVTDSHSPSAIEIAPATSPAKPVSRMVCAASPAPATPITRHRFDTSPSLAPSTAARSSLPLPRRCHFSARAIWGPSRPPGWPEAAWITAAWLRSSADRRVASRCPAYLSRSANSVAAMAGSTKSGPKRRARRASTRVRKLGVKRRASTPAAASFSRHSRACSASAWESCWKRSLRTGSDSAADSAA